MKHHKSSLTKSHPARPGGPEPTEARHEDAEYWQSRAARTRNQSHRYKQTAIRDHFAEIAAGYDELARRAREMENEADNAPQTASGPREIPQTPEEQNYRFDEKRVKDALEDDEVREALRANPKRSAEPNGEKRQ
jgi:hypothetical protein